ncbi:MAG TPA: PQQ-like beta-propeller repeat protein [Phycisphaerae bacterium]|nr:PQQ-like beta-propeller repeat protein [Phycisphaerales bacterium]HRX84542.1 PQQ-like beta-propeller repeat protein [Phycisphaerae bacterium]
MGGAALMGAVTVVLLAAPAQAQWTQWGGPHQDFIVPSAGLATSWPDDGPPKLWSRELGEGYSGILADAGKLYTLYRSGEEDVVCALDAATGKTIWEYKYAAPPAPGHEMMFTAGPRSTPLLVDGRLFAASVNGMMHAFDAATGKVLWQHDLWKDYAGSVLNHGYANSPIAYKSTIIMPVGGAGHAVMAFDQKTGEIVWQRHDFKNSYSSPRLISVDGEDQLALFMAQEIIGLDPANGDLKWSYEIGNPFDQNICMPVLEPQSDILFFSTPQAGSRGCRLTRQGDKTELEELWKTRKIQFYHVNAIRLGEWIYGSTGQGDPNFFAALNIKTGDIAWRERGFGKATCLHADGKFIILDENGMLALATATPEKFEVLAKAQVLGERAWTCPTLVGKTLYLRDSKQIVALDLG